MALLMHLGTSMLLRILLWSLSDTMCGLLSLHRRLCMRLPRLARTWGYRRLLLLRLILRETRMGKPLLLTRVGYLPLWLSLKWRLMVIRRHHVSRHRARR